MPKRYTVLPSLALAVAGLLAGSIAHAQDMAQVRKSYAQMCLQTVAMPAEHGGESDLKGNARLGAYCDCVGIPWAERAVAALNGAAAPTPAQFAKDELATRTSCRKKVGLPPPPPIKPIG